jgi:serine/threonine-protein kinase RsbT
MSVLTEDGVQAGAETVVIASEAALLRVRSALRTHAQKAGLGLTATTKLVTAGSELARNIIRYATGSEGTVYIRQCTGPQGSGVRAVFRDTGPGISDLDAAMQDGFTTAGGLGLGLPGSRRLVDDFYIDSGPGRGTTVAIEQWIR